LDGDRYNKSRYNKEYIDANKSAWEQTLMEMKNYDRQNCDRTQAVNRANVRTG